MNYIIFNNVIHATSTENLKQMTDRHPKEFVIDCSIISLVTTEFGLSSSTLISWAVSDNEDECFIFYRLSFQAALMNSE